MSEVSFVTVPQGNYLCSGVVSDRDCTPTRAILVDGVFLGSMTCDDEEHCKRAVEVARRQAGDPILSKYPVDADQLRSLSESP